MSKNSWYGEQLQKDNLYALDKNISLSSPSTKKVFEFIKKEDFIDKKVLFITNSESVNLIKSVHNLPKADAKIWNQVSVRDIMNANIIIGLEDIFKLYQNQFNKNSKSI